MIKITGKCGEGAGFITSLAIKSVLNLNEGTIVFLIDDTNEFLHLGKELNAQFIQVERENYGTDIVPLSDKLDYNKRLFIFKTSHLINEPLCMELLLTELEAIKNGRNQSIFIFYKHAY